MKPRFESHTDKWVHRGGKLFANVGTLTKPTCHDMTTALLTLASFAIALTCYRTPSPETPKVHPKVRRMPFGPPKKWPQKSIKMSKMSLCLDQDVQKGHFEYLGQFFWGSKWHFSGCRGSWKHVPRPTSKSRVFYVFSAPGRYAQNLAARLCAHCRILPVASKILHAHETLENNRKIASSKTLHPFFEKFCSFWSTD